MGAMFRHGPLVLALTALVAGCVSPSGRHKRPPHIVPPTSETMKMCVADLKRLDARYTILPDQNYGGGCSAINAVLLQAVGVPVTNTKAVQCSVARALALWVRDVAQPSAKRAFGETITRIESMGTYSCRRINGAATGKLSEHATANAIDVSGFILSDGRRILVETGWTGGDDVERKFLRALRDGACKRFQTVLSPDYNAAHYNHLHFDMGSGPYCR